MGRLTSAMLGATGSPVGHRATVAIVSHLVDVVAERFAAGGEAICRGADGRIVFAADAIPGDHVQVRITDDRDRWARGDVSAITQASPDRIAAPCPSRQLGCGGCDWAEVAPPMQIAHKAAVAADALRRTGGVRIEVEHGGSVPAVGYRSGVRVVGDDDGRAAFREARSHRTVSAMNCPVAHPYLHPLLDAVRCDPGAEVALRVSVSEGTATARGLDGARVDGLDTHCSLGDNAVLFDVIDGVRLRVSAASFFQSGPAAVSLLAATIRDLVPEISSAERVVDAYGGIGALSLLTASPAAALTVVESSASSCADARVNLANRLQSSVVESEMAMWRPEADAAPDVMIADPARTGLGRPGVHAVVRARPAYLALVGCDPVAFARDIALLSARGYRCERVMAIDLFPDTHHVECVARMVRDDSGTLSQ